MLKKGCLIVAIHFIFTFSGPDCRAQFNEYDFSQISTKQGLPGSNIMKSYQDEIGYLWFGIEAVGLCKYDGTKFKVFEFDPNNSYSLSNNFIWDIASNNMDLWIATENGLNLLCRDTEKFYRFTNDNVNLSDNAVSSLLFDNSNTLWIGTGNGINIFTTLDGERVKNEIVYEEGLDYSTIQLKKVFIPDSITNRYGKVKVVDLMQDTKGRIWVSTDNGVLIFNQNGELIKQLVQGEGTTDQLTDNSVNFIQELNDSTFLIGADRGVCLYYPEKDAYEYILSPEINELGLAYKGYYCCTIDSYGLYWIGTSEGILIIDPKKPKNDQLTFIAEGESGLTSRTIKEIIEDKNGLIWISTKFGGLHVYNRRADLFKSHKIKHIINETNWVEDNFVLSILVDKQNNIWVGTKYGGLLKFDPILNTYTSFWMDLDVVAPLNSNRVEDIIQDSQGDIWTCSLKGVSRLNASQNEFKLFPLPKVRTLFEDSKGIFWVGTFHGTYVLDKENESFENFDVAPDHFFFNNKGLVIHCIYEDSRSDLWFGTFENGAFHYSRETGKVEQYSSNLESEHKISGNMIRAIYEDSDENIWIGTKHNGLNYRTPESNEFSCYTKSDGLPSNTIYNIQSDNKGNLWMGTHNGLSVLNPLTKEFRNYDESHGLQSNIFENDAYARTEEGFLLFGGSEGFNYFHPDSVNASTVYSPIAINSFRVNNKSVFRDLSKDTAILLKHYQNFIDIEFTLLDFRNPSKNHFRYKLEGIDNEWIDAGTRNYVSYTDLKDGNYIFKLEGHGADNSQALHPIVIKIKIAAPYWQTNLAIILYILFTILLFYGIYRLATIRANFNHQLAESDKEIQRNMEVNEAKLRFFTNISHDFQTPLALISVPAERLGKSINLDDTQTKYVDLIQKNVSRLTRLIEQLMYFRRTESDVTNLQAKKGDIVSFIEEVTQPFYVFANKHNISFSLRKFNDIPEIWFDPDKIERIINNLLMNAFKYTSQGGSVEVVISTNKYNKLGNYAVVKRKRGYERMVKIQVIDTGKGMTSEELKNIFTRFYTGKNGSSNKGTGIGLELTKALVELHGGRISVGSNEGKGSAFTIYLYTDNKHIKKANISNEAIVPDQYTSQFDYSQILSESFESSFAEIERKNKKGKSLVLIVEDNSDLRNFLGENLLEYYNVISANNGKEGLDLAISKVPDLIISDVMMPEMDGIEMCKKIKSNIISSHIPIILLTRKNLIEDKITGLQTGADDYVEKPFNLQYLLLRINNLLASYSKIKDQVMKELHAGEVELQSVSTYDKKLLNKCKESVLNNIADANFSVVELGSDVGLSRSQLYRKLTALTGKSPADFIYSNRLAEAKKYLLQEKYSVMDVAHLTGFKSSNSFSTVFKKNFGISPKEYINKHKV